MVLLMATRKRARKAPPGAPARFFTKQLSGEQAPSLDTVTRLYAQSLAFYRYELWELLTEDQLAVVEVPGGDVCYCSVMGMQGEVMALHVYLGAAGLAFFRAVYADQIQSVADFYGKQDAVYVHFVAPDLLESADREMLRVFNHPYARAFSPQFRRIRPGSMPWFVTEEEAGMLSHCLDRMIRFAQRIAENPEADYWSDPRFLPKLLPGVTPKSIEIELVEPPPAAIAMPVKPELDRDEIERLRKGAAKGGAAIEMDVFLAPTPIGVKNERKMLPRLAMAVDAKSGFCFPPALGEPSKTDGEQLVAVAMSAVRQTKTIPSEIRVQDREHKIVLSGLAEALGCTVRLMGSLPALEEAKEAILKMMGDPGPIPS
jgi:hypothetical protein